MSGPVFDHALMFFSTGDLAATSTTSGALKIRTTPVSGMAVRINVPGTHTTTKTLQAVVLVSADNSTYVKYASGYQAGTITLAAATPKELIVPIITSYKYVKLELTPAGGTGSLGAVKAGLVSGVGYDFSRKVDWN